MILFHLHKPSNDIIVIDIIKYIERCIIISHVAALNDIFMNKNVFITGGLEGIEIKHEKATREHKKGSKSMDKKRNRNKGQGSKKPDQKRCPKNYFINFNTLLF